MTTPICTINASGIHRPTLQECVDYFNAQYRSIFGQDVYIEPDSQDGQMLAIFAKAVDDINGMAVSVYNAFSPSTAQGVGLSRVIKINGITRNIATYSDAVVKVVGIVGTVITNGQARDENGYVWALPETVTIPISGEINVTATCTTLGAVAAVAGAINEIATPQEGWQTVNNPSAAAIGAPVETDAEVRIRQAFSASLPALGTIQGLRAAVADAIGIARYRVYENNHPGADPKWGIPGYSVAVVTEGGLVPYLANVIYSKKGSGVRTYGTMTVPTSEDDAGIAHQIQYSPLVNVNVSVFMRIVALEGFTQVIEDTIRQYVADFINDVGIGNTVEFADVYMAARMNGDPMSKTYRVVPGSLGIARDGQATAEQDVSIAFNEAAYCEPAFVTLRLPIL